MTIQRVRTFFKTHRTAVIISVVAAIVVGSLTAYTLWSMSTWSRYETVSKNWREELKTDTASALGLPADTTEKRDQKRIALKSIADRIASEGDSPCKIHTLLQWQQGMGYAKPKIEECEKRIAALGEFRNSLIEVVEYLENEKLVADAFVSASQPEKVADKDFGMQATVWQASDSAISKITATTAFGPVKTEASNVAKGISAAWQAVIAANDAKDKKKYEEAAAGLAVAYKGIESVTALSEQKLEPLTRTLEEKYRAAF